MILNKTNIIVFIVGAALGLLSGFFIGKGIYDRPIETKVERDTVTHWDTIPHWYPKPVEVERLRTEYKWLTRVQPVGKTDTLTLHDSVLVEVPITSKHYNAPEYDAWVSGYEPSLDSIFVYQKETVITDVRTISKPPNKWELDIVGGIEYNTAKQKYTPYAGGELLYKPSRLQFGIQGGIIKADKVEPFVGGKVKIRVF